MGGSSSTHQEQSNKIDPMQMAEYQQNYSHAQNGASTLTPYTGQITAGFNPNQIQAQGLLSNIAQDPRYATANQNAVHGAQGVLDSNPLETANLQKFMNPFQKDVIDASIAQNGYARAQQGILDNASATNAHAFGGSRQGVQRAETTAGYDRNNQVNLATLNSANFGQAQNAALSDANLKLNAAGQLQSLNQGSLQTAMQQGGILSAVGDAQQQQQQRELTDAYNAYTQGQQLTLTQQQLLNQALGIIPIQQTTTSDSTTKSNPGVMGVIGGIANLGMAAASVPGLTSGLSGLFGASKTLSPSQLSTFMGST